MKVSLIVTTYNEEETIVSLLESIAKQTRKADEVVIVDGGSLDKTINIVQKFQQEKKFDITLIQKKSNRSHGRNLAIKKATHSWIAITDSGCILDSYWLENLLRCQKQTGAEIIAGNQMGMPRNNFQKAVVPYVLVMQDKINQDDYLPATRSVLLNKNVWSSLHGFNQELEVSEDLDFFLRAKREEYSFAFCRSAIVYWQPRKNIYQFFQMIFAFAQGDILAGIYRKKVYFLFFRYFIFGCFFLSFLLLHDSRIVIITYTGILAYIGWAIIKNKKYVSKAWYWLPCLQLSSDMAVLFGTMRGMQKKLTKRIPHFILLLGLVFFTTGCQTSEQTRNTNDAVLMQEQSTRVETEVTGIEERISAYQTFNRNDFENAKDKKRILFFHATWCPTCKAADMDIKQRLGEIPEDVIIFKTDYDTEKELKSKYAVTYQHTFVLVDAEGNEITKWNGGDTDEILQYAQAN